jgi:GMP synthase (glutamine-hydrolysing)
MAKSEEQAGEWLVFRHVEHEHIGTLAGVMNEIGIPYRYADLFRHEPVPARLDQIAGLIVMGGPMGVYDTDRYPFLKQEKALIRQASKAGLPVLGICLGAQLIASALGAKVYPGPQKEIGWYPVEVVAPNDEWTAGLPPQFMGFHWHGDTFDLPPGAVRLFGSKLYENQGFRLGANVLAIQFHFEVNAQMVNEWLEDEGCSAELRTLPDASPKKIRLETEQWSSQLEELSDLMFRKFLRGFETRAIGSD